MTTIRNNPQSTDFNAELFKAIGALPFLTEELTEKSKHLESAIQKWISHVGGAPPQTGQLIYLLDDSSKTDFSIESLTPTDLTRFRYLEELGSRCHFSVFIAHVEKKAVGTRYDGTKYAFEEVSETEEEEEEEEEEGPQDGDENIDIVEWTIQVRLAAGSGGKPHVLDVEPDSVLQGDVFEEYDPDEEDGLGDEYDEPAHPDALLMVPQATTVKFFADIFLKSFDDDLASDLLEYFSSKSDWDSYDGLVRLIGPSLPPELRATIRTDHGQQPGTKSSDPSSQATDKAVATADTLQKQDGLSHTDRQIDAPRSEALPGQMAGQKRGQAEDDGRPPKR
ncbi:hypothetical protein AAE478_000130 [Parahypoxylon ruwenzoriense]